MEELAQHKGFATGCAVPLTALKAGKTVERDETLLILFPRWSCNDRHDPSQASAPLAPPPLFLPFRSPLLSPLSLTAPASCPPIFEKKETRETEQ